MKTKLLLLALTICSFVELKAQTWGTGGNTLTGTLPSSPTEWLGSGNGGDLIIKTNNTERMRLLSSGYVGIGATNPQNNLEIQSTNAQLLGLTHSAASVAAAAPSLRFYSLVSGTRTEMYLLGDYSLSDEGLAIWNRRNDAIRFATNNAERVIITAAGDVGIGTSSPGTKLEVAGQIKITGGSPGSGKVLTSDANGLATWTTVASSGAWTTTGNSGTVDGTNFIGTTDDVPFNIRVNNQNAGRIDRANLNTFFGYQAGDLGTGSANTFIGYNAGKANTTGFSSTATGHRALYSNTEGYQNNALGYQALFSNTTGDENVAIGSSSLTNNTDGFGNCGLGNESLFTNSTGNYNTATGNLALHLNATGDYNSAHGNQALRNTTGDNNTALGNQSLYSNTTGSSNTAVGYQAGYDGTIHSQCTFIGASSTLTTNRTNVTLLGYGIVNAQSTANNQVCLGNTAVTQVRAPAAVTGFTSYSDSRCKTNIKEDVAGLDFILKLKPVTYNVRPRELHKIWGTPDSVVNKMDFSETEKETRIGFIAQEVEKAAKESGFNFPGIDVPRNNKEVYTLRYVDFIMPMIKGMQEQQTIIDSVKTDNSALKERLDQQDATIAALKKQMEQLVSAMGSSALSTRPSTAVELSDKNAIVLDQNIPNPFMEQTLITYFIPENVLRAQIVFSDQSGKLIKTVELQQKGKGSLNIYANDLSNGIYSYSIIADGQLIETKKMVKTK